MLTSFLAALQFLTITPPLIRRPFSMPELGRSVGFFPAVGWIIGGILWGLARALTPILPSSVAAALLMGLWIIITGAIHFDGFLDMCDGLFGGHDADARLRIMRDHRVGAFATAGGGLLLLLQFAALSSMTPALRSWALLLAPVLGRWAAAQAIVWAPYARPQGLGRAMKDNARWPQALLATIFLAPMFWFFPLAAALGLAAALLTLGGVLFITLRRIPGLTGDIYGAIIVLVEVATLVVFSAMA